MTLWIVLTLMIAVAAVGLALPLVRRREGTEARDDAAAVLKRQLGDLELQVAQGSLTEDEAQGLKTEVKRRILAETRGEPAAARPFGDRTLARLALGLAAVVALSGAGLYSLMGRPDLAKPRPAAPEAPGSHPSGDVAAMIGQLEAALRNRPEDPEGWRMLGWSYFQTGRYADAAQAYARAAALEPGNAEHRSAQGESLVQAAAGAVTPQALEAFRAALAVDPNDPRARYFLAMHKDQQGDAAGAMADWIALVNEAPPGAPWGAEVRAFVERVARERGVDLTGRLKPASAAQAGPAPGPTPDQVAAAQAMAPQDREAMVRGMVEGLDARLRSAPNDAEGWIRLMRARMVLGEPQAAADAYRRADNAFRNDPATRTSLREAARGMGVPGA